MRRLRIATFNILHGRRADGGRVDLGALVESVRGLDADIVALQEVDARVPRSRLADQAATVASALGMEMVFGRTARVGVVGRFGNALLARGPITEVELVRLSRTQRSHVPRGAIVATVTIDRVRVSVATAHLSVRRPEVFDQLTEVVQALGPRAAPRVLLGDLNLGPGEVAPMLEAAGFTLADPARPTYPRSEPRHRIDHVAVTGLDVTSVEVVPTALSDHCALVVDVTVSGPPVD